MNNYNGEMMSSEQVENLSKKSTEAKFVEYHFKGGTLTPEQMELIETYSTDDLKVQKIQEILANNMIAEEEAKKEAEKQELKEEKELAVKRVNRWMFIVITYLIIIPIASYYLVSNLTLSFLNSLGALGVTLAITGILTVLLIIRWFIIEYHDIKGMLKHSWETEVFFDITLGNVLTIAALIIAVIKLVF